MSAPDSTLISALRILARDVESDDGVANTMLFEAAERFGKLVLEAHNLRADVERLSAQNALLLGQRERAMQAARWLRSYRPSAKQFKAAEVELETLEKEVQG